MALRILHPVVIGHMWQSPHQLFLRHTNIVPIGIADHTNSTPNYALLYSGHTNIGNDSSSMLAVTTLVHSAHCRNWLSFTVYLQFPRGCIIQGGVTCSCSTEGSPIPDQSRADQSAWFGSRDGQSAADDCVTSSSDQPVSALDADSCPPGLTLEVHA